MHRDRLALAVAVVLTLAVPTAAAAVGPSPDEELDPVALAPADGPNGAYASVEDGELRVAFEALNDDAVTVADRVFTITATGERPVRVWLTFDDGRGVTAHRGDDPTERIDGAARATVVEPGETVAVGFRLDTFGPDPGATEMTVHAVPDDGSGPSPPGGERPGEPPDTGTPEPPAGEPQFDVVALTAPSTATVGEPVAVEATVANRGGADGEYVAELVVDGTVVARTPVGVPAGGTRTVTFERTFDGPGEYVLEVGDERATVDVGEPSDPAPAFEVREVRVADREIDAGNGTTVVATVENVGDADGEFEAEFAVAGVVVESTTVAVPAGERRQVGFDWQFEDPGIYRVAVGGVPGGEVVVRAGDGGGERRLASSFQATVLVPVVGGLLFAIRWRRRR